MSLALFSPFLRVDTFSREGAEALADQINAYWRARGYEVYAHAQEVGFHPAIRERRFDIRSGLVNGLPPKSAKKRA